MSKTPEKKSLLDLMVPPQGQSLRSAVLTTFDLDLDYLERFVLPTMVGINTAGSDEESSTGSRTNLEVRSRLRKSNVAILADKRRFEFAAQKSMETYELLFAETFPAFHPKLFLLAYENEFRMVVASANLTEHGFHSNLEVLWHASTENGDRFGNLAREAVEFLSSVATREWPGSRALAQTLAELKARLPKGRGPGRLLHSGNHLPLAEQWRQEMKGAERFDEFHIVTPFFDQSGDLQPLGRFEAPRVHLYVMETSVDGRPKFRLRVKRQTLSKLKPVVRVIDAQRMSGNGESTKASVRTGNVGRVLHAKVYAAKSGEEGWLLLGSPNFSYRAFLAAGRQRNAEVAVAVSGKWKAMRQFLPTVSREISWESVEPWTAEREEKGAAWLPFLQSAEFDASEKRLTLVFSQRRPSGHWAVRYRRKVLTDGARTVFPRSKVFAFALGEGSSLQLVEGGRSGWFPIGVKDKEMLPELPGLNLPNYQDILDLLAHGVANLSQLMSRRVIRMKGAGPAATNREQVAYLEAQTRLMKAMENMKRRLSAKLTTPGEAKSIFDGDLGFNRVVEGIRADRGLENVFRIFALLELQSLLASVAWRGRKDAVRAARKLADRTKRRLIRHIRATERVVESIPVEMTKLRKLYLSGGASGWKRTYEPHQG